MIGRVGSYRVSCNSTSSSSAAAAASAMLRRALHDAGKSAFSRTAALHAPARPSGRASQLVHDGVGGVGKLQPATAVWRIASEGAAAKPAGQIHVLQDSNKRGAATGTAAAAVNGAPFRFLAMPTGLRWNGNVGVRGQPQRARITAHLPQPKEPPFAGGRSMGTSASSLQGRGDGNSANRNKSTASTAVSEASSNGNTAAAGKSALLRAPKALLSLLAAAVAQAMGCLMFFLRARLTSLERRAAAGGNMISVAMGRLLLALDQISELLARLFLGPKTTRESQEVEAALRKLRKLLYGEHPQPPKNGDEEAYSFFKDLPGASAMGGESKILLQALDKIFNQLDHVFTEQRTWLASKMDDMSAMAGRRRWRKSIITDNFFQMIVYGWLGLSIGTSKFFALLRQKKGEKEWDRFMETFEEMTGSSMTEVKELMREAIEEMLSDPVLYCVLSENPFF